MPIVRERMDVIADERPVCASFAPSTYTDACFNCGRLKFEHTFSVSPVAQIEYHHVHKCQATMEDRPCLFEWRGHMESKVCACGPDVDESNVLLDGQVFVVHKGVC